MKKILLLIISITLFAACKEQAKEITIKLGEVPQHAQFISDTMSIWGSSVVKDDEGVYHMFYSRWPKRLGWSWVTDSEIARATADNPFGPYTFQEVVLPKRGAEYWDGLCTHNPKIYHFDGKYYLYYMGTTGDGVVTTSPGKNIINWKHRNLQRIGVAVSDTPYGPWKRFDEPVIDVGDKDAIDGLMISNPSVAQRPEGGYLMVYKAARIDEKKGIRGGAVVHSVATADSPVGPFIKSYKKVFHKEGAHFPAEDPSIWYQDGKYRAVVKDMNGAFTDAGRALVMFESLDGFDWVLAPNPLVSKLEIRWKDAQSQQVKHLERPEIYIENGKPVALLCASDTLDENNVLHSFNVQIPIE